jgi:hypothetical protein
MLLTIAVDFSSSTFKIVRSPSKVTGQSRSFANDASLNTLIRDSSNKNKNKNEISFEEVSRHTNLVCCSHKHYFANEKFRDYLLKKVYYLF